MQDELENNHEDYRSILHEDWCDLLYNIEVKDNRKRDTTQIKRLATSKAALVNSDNNESVMVTHKKRVRTGVLTNSKQQGGKIPKHHGTQCYCLI